MSVQERILTKSDREIREALEMLSAVPMDDWESLGTHRETIGSNDYDVAGFKTVVEINDGERDAVFEQLILRRFFGPIYTRRKSEHFRIRIKHEENDGNHLRERFVDPATQNARQAKDLAEKLLTANPGTT